MRRVLALAAAATVLVAAAPRTLNGEGRPAPTRIEVGRGVYLFMTPPYGDVGLDGNSIAILSRDGVLVFDTNGTPAAAAAVLAEIRALTDNPVRYVVNSHWHWDHWYGTQEYRRAWPDVQVVAHEKTRGVMMGPALAFNKPGLEVQLPAYIESLTKKAAASPELATRLADDRFFLDQKRSVQHVFPGVTFSD